MDAIARAPFRVSEYVRAHTVEEAVEALAHFGSRAAIIAGGTNVLVDRPRVDALIDIRRLGLRHLRDGGGLAIGALATVADLQSSPLLAGPLRIVADAARAHGHALLRHLATIGGNLCKAHPVLDFPPPLLALDAEVRLRGAGGARTLPIAEFFLDFQRTALGEDEILTEIAIPAPAPGTGSALLRQGWTRVDLAIASAAVVLTLAPDGICRKARIALGTAGPTPMRAREAEAGLEGRPIDESAITRAAATAAGEARPMSFFRGPQAYKRHVIRVFVARGLAAAAGRAREAA